MNTTGRIPHASDALVVIDMTGTILHWDSAAEQLYGWTARDALGRRSGDLLVPDRLRSTSAEIFARLADGHAWSGQFEFRHRDGSEVLVNLVKTPIKGPGGRVVAILGSSHRRVLVPDLLSIGEIYLSPDALTESERSVIALLGNGLTNEEIATALGVTTGSIAAHVQSILTMLNVTTRVQIAIWAVRHGLSRPRENESV